MMRCIKGFAARLGELANASTIVLVTARREPHVFFLIIIHAPLVFLGGDVV